MTRFIWIMGYLNKCKPHIEIRWIIYKYTVYFELFDMLLKAVWSEYHIIEASLHHAIGSYYDIIIRHLYRMCEQTVRWVLQVFV